MRSVSIVFCVFVVLLSFNITQATIIHVPAEQTTIQAGINASANGDTVLVAPGTYYEHINFNGKTILVKSEVGPESTVVEKVRDGVAIIAFRSWEDTASVLDGFCIQNAINADGVECMFSSPKIINNIIKNNSKEGDGGGLFCVAVNGAIIQGNRFIGNTASEKGGGLYLNGEALVKKNLFKSNYAGDGGGAISVVNSSNTIVTENLIVQNETDDDWGGVVYQEGGSYVQFTNNTISGNVKTGDSKGAGITIIGGMYTTLNNNCITYNSSFGVYAVSATDLTVEYNDVFDNLSGNYFGCSPGIGSISLNPFYCDTTTQNYYLTDVSPCVGAGQEGVDIGAFGIGCIAGDANGDGWIDISDVVYLINYIYRNGPTPNYPLAGDADCDGVVDANDMVYTISYLFKGGPPPGC